MTADAPAWGTSPQAGPREWMVTGFYNENGQTFRFTVKADTAREAEDLTMRDEAAPEGKPIVTAVLTIERGQIIDGREEYAQYLLLDDERNKRAP